MSIKLSTPSAVAAALAEDQAVGFVERFGDQLAGAFGHQFRQLPP